MVVLYRLPGADFKKKHQCESKAKQTTALDYYYSTVRDDFLSSSKIKSAVDSIYFDTIVFCVIGRSISFRRKRKTAPELSCFFFHSRSKTSEYGRPFVIF